MVVKIAGSQILESKKEAHGWGMNSEKLKKVLDLSTWKFREVVDYREGPGPNTEQRKSRILV